MKRKKLYFDDWLKDKLRGPAFKRGYEEARLRAKVALRIAELRRERGLSQADLAKRMRTTQQAISDIETFRHDNVTLLTLQKIAQALGGRLTVDLR